MPIRCLALYWTIIVIISSASVDAAPPITTTASPATPPPYRIYGETAKPGQLPFAVWLKSCTASIIDSRTILTAAHCVCRKRKHKTALLGAVHALHKSQHSKVIQLDTNRQYMHPGYHSCGFVSIHDIAILKTKEPIKFTKYIQKVDLCKYNAKPGDLITVAGYGRDENKHFGKLKFVSNRYSHCTRYVGAICQSMSLNTPYYGDSGGPLFEHEPKSGNVSQIGVVSGGDFITYEAVYASVCKHIDWIRSHME